MSDWINDRAAPLHRPGAARWWVVVPVKGGPGAKSRLQVPEGVDRLALARAIAMDTLQAAADALGSANVLVVTSDPLVSSWSAAAGFTVVEDPGAGLNGAIRRGAAAVPDTGAHVAALLGDLPALRPAELRQALAAATGFRSAFVPDAEGTGTVLLCAREGSGLVPRFGRGSAGAHESAGSMRLDLDVRGLRRDVDDQDAMRTALGLGVGRHTAQLLAHLVTI